jgi:hypothetical protein
MADSPNLFRGCRRCCLQLRRLGSTLLPRQARLLNALTAGTRRAGTAATAASSVARTLSKNPTEPGMLLTAQRLDGEVSKM